MDLRGISQSRHTPELGYVKADGAFSRSRRAYKPVAVLDLRSLQPRAAGVSENLILSGLPVEMLRTLEPALKLVSLAKQQFVFHENDRLDFVYFPVTAVISEFRMLEDGRMVEIAVTGRDGAIGLTPFLLDSLFASNIAQVSQAGTARRVNVETFASLLRSNEKARTSLARFVDQYIKQISQKAICNKYHSAKERFCTWLLMVQDRCSKTTLNLTHEQISRILGVYRPSVTFIAQELRDDNLINYSRGGILICDRKRIEASACECYLSPEWA